MCRFTRQVVDLRNAELHARSQFVAGDPSRQFSVARILLEVTLVHSMQKRARCLIAFCRDVPVGPEMPQGAAGAELGSLEFGGQKSRSPVVDAGLRNSTRIKNRHEGRQVLVGAAERIAGPGSQARKSVLHETGREKIFCWPVGIGFAGQRMDEGKIIGQLGEMRNHIRHHLAGPAARPKFILRASQVARRSLEGHRRTSLQWLAILPDQLRFVVPGLQAD